MNNYSLKPCPFCGGKVTLTYNSASNTFNIYHISNKPSEICPFVEPIQIDGTIVKSLKEAADIWNMRGW